jgi:hypothetical protein
MDFQKPATTNMQMPNIQVPQALQTGLNSVQDSFKRVTDTIASAKDNVTNSINTFSQQPGASTEFIFSNTIIAKFAFLILVIIVFMFLMSLGISLILYFSGSSSNPYLIKGIINGNSPKVISQNPKNSKSVMINRSNNQSTGIEFTWSVWLYVDQVGIDANKYQHIFNKGNNNYSGAAVGPDGPIANSTGIANVNNGPGLYLVPGTNRLYIKMDTVELTDTANYIIIDNIPLKNWFHVAIRLENTMLDIYVNGTITGRLNLQKVPRQNYHHVLVCQNGGFSGNLSDLRYFESALNVFEITSIVSKGPTMKAYEPIDEKNKNFFYLSNTWYTSRS